MGCTWYWKNENSKKWCQMGLDHHWVYLSGKSSSSAKIAYSLPGFRTRNPQIRSLMRYHCASKEDAAVSMNIKNYYLIIIAPKYLFSYNKTSFKSNNTTQYPNSIHKGGDYILICWYHSSWRHVEVKDYIVMATFCITFL